MIAMFLHIDSLVGYSDIRLHQLNIVNFGMAVLMRY